MNEPISESLLQAAIDWASVDSCTRHIASGLKELQQSRALLSQLGGDPLRLKLAMESLVCEVERQRAVVTQHNELVAKLRELAERMRVSWAEQSQSESQYASGHSEANGEWLDEIDSLLSALGAAQAEKP